MISRIAQRYISSVVIAISTMANAPLSSDVMKSSQETNSQVHLPDLNYSPLCKKNGLSIASLDEIFILENTTIYENGLPIYKIINEHIVINTIDGQIMPIYPSDFFKDLHNLDLKLKFAIINGNLFLFWRETYINRPAKFGLITLERDLRRLEMVCMSEDTSTAR